MVTRMPLIRPGVSSSGGDTTDLRLCTRAANPDVYDPRSLNRQRLKALRPELLVRVLLHRSGGRVGRRCLASSGGTLSGRGQGGQLLGVTCREPAYCGAIIASKEVTRSEHNLPGDADICGRLPRSIAECIFCSQNESDKDNASVSAVQGLAGAPPVAPEPGYT